MEEKFTENKYKNQYQEKYTTCKLVIKPEEFTKLEEYREVLGLSKNAFFIRCALYCAENDIRVEELPEK